MGVQFHVQQWCSVIVVVMYRQSDWRLLLSHSFNDGAMILLFEGFHGAVPSSFGLPKLRVSSGSKASQALQGLLDTNFQFLALRKIMANDRQYKAVRS